MNKYITKFFHKCNGKTRFLKKINKISTFQKVRVNILQKSSISTSTPNFLIQKYRQQKGQPLNANTRGPLTDLPDYSFLDGRPTPLGMHQHRRKVKQEELCKRIIQLSQEMDFAVQRHAEKIKSEQEMKDNIIRNKLKPKGHLLLKNK